jgi:peptide deformylase
MSVLKIEMLGAELLRRPAKEVVEIDEEIRLLVDDMFHTMYDAEGVGLAGPQVGVSRRVIVVDVREEGQQPFALINPRVVESSAEREKAEEGCLSIPGVSAAVERPVRVVVEGLDADGHPVRFESEGLLARCLQHEVDHLDGVLFIDRLSPLKRRMVLQKYKRLASEASGTAQEKGTQRRDK